jgi:hippurate hydrolase
MPIYNRIAEFQDDLIATRRDIHENPELGFEENRTSDLVAKQLESWGIEVHRDIAKTGLVGVLKGNGNSPRTIGIRADMDALPMSEEGTPIYKSKNDGKMHACGHDGHTTMLLGAARYLAETRNFDGTVNFIFQPAEEGGGGGRVMVEEGVFEKFPCDTVWGMHNDPKLPAGTLATRPGPLMAAVDTVKITINAVGCHAAMPHIGIDPIAVAVQLYTAMQTIVARNVDPIKSAVVSVTMFHAGSASNVIASSSELTASIRTFDPEIRKLIEHRIREICKGMETAHNVNIDIDYDNGYPATINHAKEAAEAIDIAKEIVDESMIDDNIAPVMGGEDFSYMLEARPGAFLWIGGGKTE